MNDELAAQLETLHRDAFGWALHCCSGDHSRAEEVLQNAYVKVAGGTAAHGATAAFKTWWFGVIRFTAREEWRRVRFRESLLGRLVQLVSGAQDNFDPQPSPARRLELSEETQHLRRLLAELPARQAEVLHLVFYQELSLTEAAEVMRVSVGSVRQHYERGKQRLRTLYETSPETLAHGRS